jgi:hypothetical protein
MSSQWIHTDNKCLNLNAATGAHLGNLGSTTSDRLNYTSLVIRIKEVEYDTFGNGSNYFNILSYLGTKETTSISSKVLQDHVNWDIKQSYIEISLVNMVFFNNVYWQKIGNCLEVFSNVNSLILWNISPSFWDQRIEKKKSL